MKRTRRHHSQEFKREGVVECLPEFWAKAMLGFPQPEEDQHEEAAIAQER